MEFREAALSEYPKIYRQGYQEWAKGRSFEQYIKDNKKEEMYGKRYVLVHANEEIIASLILLRFTPDLFGIGSIVVAPAFRGQGAAKRMIKECLAQHPDAAFMLYSEIGTAYYERFGFCPLPKEHQQASRGVGMVRAKEEVYKRLLDGPIPGYF